VEVLRLRSTFCKVAGRALVDGELAAEAVLSTAMVDRGPVDRERVDQEKQP
jgi:hypothetical protein